MTGLIVPYFAQAQTGAITIDGVTYRVPLIDSGGRVYVNAKATGASEVKSALIRSASPSNTRATVATPTSGKKIRVIAALLSTTYADLHTDELYFGTGQYITTNPGKEILYGVLFITSGAGLAMGWPDGGGPVGDVNDVVSLRTNVDLTTTDYGLIHYREE